MTNIYINGLSGKMGSSICDLSTNDETISIVNDDIKNADVVIDFSRPDSSPVSYTHLRAHETS